MRSLLCAGLFALMALGCASTTVRKNPGRLDRGVRYNLPKPYLLLQPAVAVEEKTGKITGYLSNKVNISLEMGPDYSEEYSIHVRAGVGINKTAISLEDGWKLTQINYSIDSSTSENISAVADLISNLPKFSPSGGGADAGVKEVAREVSAYNVPLGYYESIIGVDSRGKKRLYGWRYVGFLPFNACPTTACGAQAADCRDGEIFGLVFEKGTMMFRRLDYIAAKEVESRIPPPPPEPEKK